MRRTIGEEIDKFKKILKEECKKEIFDFTLKEATNIIKDQIDKKNVE